MANNGIYYSSGNTLNFTTNNTTWATLTSGGTFQKSAVSATTYYNLPPATFTGGTVSGSTNFTGGLTANTISATTYYNLPTDVFVTGGTYTSGNAIFTNNTGGTFSVTGFPVGGGGGQTFYLNLSQSQGSNRLLSTTGSTASEQSTGVTINNGVTGTIASFQSQPLNTTLLPGGIWSFYLHSYKQNNNASFNMFVEVYKRTSGGTQTLLFTTDPAPVTTNSPNPSMQLTDGYFSGTPLSVSDSIVAVVRATNTGNQSHIITLVSEGSQHYSYVVSTIPTQQGLTCDTLSGCSIIQTIQTNITNKFDKSGGTVTGGTVFQSGLTANTISATTYQNLPQSVSGGGTTNYISKWTGSTGLGNSQIYDDGSIVYIGGSQVLGSYFSVTGTVGINEFQIQATSGSLGITDTDLSAWTTGGAEIAIGSNGPLASSTGSNNVAIGSESMFSNTSGSANVAVGRRSLSSNQAGQANVAIGYRAGGDVDSGSYNVFIGYEAGNGVTTEDNRLYIANNTYGTLIYGEFDNGIVGINTTTPIAALDVSGNTRIDGSFTANTVSATTYYNYPGSSSANCVTTFFVTNISGCSPVNILSPLNVKDGLSVTGTSTFTSQVNFTGGLSASTFSASTYQNLPSFNSVQINGITQFSGDTNNYINFSGINITITSAATNTLVFSAGTGGGGGGISGGGTTNYIPKFTGSTGIGNSQLQDDGSQVFTNQGYGSPLTGNLSINASGTTGIAGRATQYGVYGTFSGATAGASAVYGEAGKGQYGLYGYNLGDSAGEYIGVFGAAQQADSGVAGTVYIGGKFYGDNGTGGGYSVQLQDGTEGVGKVLVSQTSDGKANWNTFSGINITITSAATNTLVFSAGTGGGGGVTQIVAGTNITISPAGGTGVVTINSTASGGTGSVNLGTVYTTANNFNFL